MNDLLAALLLGIIEGITEFLPISSTGHLLIAERWLGARSDLFNIAIQAGAILAVVLIYRQRLWQLVSGLRDPDNRDYALKLAASFGVTAVLGVMVKELGFELPDTLGPIAWALVLGGFFMLFAEHVAARRSSAPATARPISWTVALLVGVAQVLAGVFPGTSRSAAAIFAALLFGTGGRLAATEFAFLVGIPTMFAATGYELLHTLKDGGAASEDWNALAVAFGASALTAFAAVKWLLSYIQTHRFTVFSWYRIVLGAGLLVWLHMSGATITHAAGSPGSGAWVAPAAGPMASTMIPVPERDLGSRRASPRGETSRLLASARARFDQLQLCSHAKFLKNFKPDEPRHTADLASEYPGIVAMARRELAWRHEMVAWIPAVLDQASRECAGTDFSREAMAEAALRAANLGDFGAAECYFTLAPVSLPSHSARIPPTPSELEANANYVTNARQLIARGLAAGDWRMVSQAAMSADGRNWSGIDDRSDPTLGYRMHRLMQRGLTEAKHRDGMRQAADVEQQQLKVDQLRAADAWVDVHYRRDFADKPLMDYGAMCPFPGQPLLAQD